MEIIDKSVNFLKEAFNELKLVSWLSKKELIAQTTVVVILITALLINQNRFDTNSKADFIDPRQTNCFRMCVDNNTDCNACLPNKKPIRLISPRPIRSFPVVTVPPRTPLPTVEIN